MGPWVCWPACLVAVMSVVEHAPAPASVAPMRFAGLRGQRATPTSAPAATLQKLKPGGHRVLVYSQFRLMLDVLEWYCQARGHSYLRLDSSVGEQPAQLSAHMLHWRQLLWLQTLQGCLSCAN